MPLAKCVTHDHAEYNPPGLTGVPFEKKFGFNDK
jgi:hypothetical protein